MTTIHTSLSQQFWSKFALNNWEKDNLAIKHSFISPPVASDELFKIVVNDFNTADDVHDRTRFYIGEKLQELDKSDIRLPQKEDASFASYNQRISTMLNGQEYALVIDAIKVNDVLWDWTYDFLQSLYKSLGYISYGHFYSIFYGNYQVTPFGVHFHFNPAESAFYFPINGGKSMRTWTPEFVNKHPKLKGAKNYQDFLESSTLLQAEPGGMIYWPSDRWHVGDSRGGDVSIVLAINTSSDLVMQLSQMICDEVKYLYGDSIKGFFFKRITQALAQWHSLNEEMKILGGDSFKGYPVSPLIRAGIGLLSLILSIIPSRQITTKSFFNPDDLQESAEKIPESIQLAAKKFKWIVDSIIVERASTKLWLTMLTCYGFWPLSVSQIISDKKVVLTNESSIQVFPKRKILFRQVDRNNTFVFVNGIGINVTSHPIFPLIIKKINSVEIQNVVEILQFSRTVVDDSNNNCQIADILKFLEELLLYRGIKIVK
ncbi:hypothetical protein H6G97_31340 [Nostoc flagelliforme FACHB-838]|uniref:JmjC domain-containing protein n=1 Tax=Nostoc flagelliforme FACHB-838 TaxID=2692904 RepID=A0ABR8DXC9_9NOSO|nr:hypothetical protein [Nostoc flagelliforme]MBD2533808.1 hypothetical protein [Nostoc flagelliforme FACHB-838]